MKLSSRTFGVEFELFFEEEDMKKFVQDNVKYIDIKPSKEDIEDFRDQYQYCKRKGQTLKSFIAEQTEEYISNRIRDIVDFDHERFNLVQDVLEKRLKLDGWDIHDDCSIEGDITMEIVTPILKGKQGLKDITKFLNYFGKYASVNESCGLHVHVGASDFIKSKNSSELFAAALLYYSSFEKLFDSLVIEARREDNNDYTLSPIKAEEIIRAFMSGSKGHKIQYERYHKVNLCSIDEHGTIEFRHMHGVLDPRVVTNWVKVCTSYVDMVKENYAEWNAVTTFKPNKKKYSNQEHTSNFKNLINTIHQHYSYILSLPDKALVKKIADNLVVNEAGILTVPKIGMSKEKFVSLINYIKNTRATFFSTSNLFKLNAISQDADNFYVKYHEDGIIRNYDSDFTFEGLDIALKATKRKVASKRGYPKGLPVHAIKQIKKVNEELFGKKMAA